MTEMEIIDVTRDALWLLIKLSLPFMLVALVVGLAISLFQALTQIQEMTISFVPKMIAIYLTIILLLPMLISSLTEFNAEMADRIVKIE